MIQIAKFKDLSKEDQLKAVLNYWEDHLYENNDFYQKYMSSKEFEEQTIDGLFLWDESREGFDYWYNIAYEKILNTLNK